ncbi:T9SS type A sorting domain-containing protein [bacterium]|nr:T9SS type A sorting domain-containing protein [bacterium]
MHIHLNVGTAQEPRFDSGARVQVGPPGAKVDLNVGYRATPDVVDWNEDGLFDLLVGAYDGKLRLYLNEGGGLPPDFRHTLFVSDGSGDLVVPLGYASPTMADFDGDDAKDLVIGNAEGELYFYANAGTQAAPLFGVGWRCESLSLPIDLGYQGRARPFALDWDGDGRQDLLSGSNQGKVHLFLGQPNSVAVPFLPGAGARLSAWPNPARPATTFAFALPRAARVALSVHDVTGRELVTLVADSFGAGTHAVAWDGRDAGGRALPSGLYLLRLRAGDELLAGKLLLLR